jgi:hypothetical protein
MSEQFLNDTQIRSAIEKMCCERVSQRVWVNFGAKAGSTCGVSHCTPRRLASQSAATSCDEERRRLRTGGTTTRWCPGMKCTPLTKICTHRVNRRLPNWHNALASALAKEPHGSLSKINSIEIQIDDLTDPTPRTVEQFAECARALCVSRSGVTTVAWRCECDKQPLHLVRSQYCREAPPRARKINLTAQ